MGAGLHVKVLTDVENKQQLAQPPLVQVEPSSQARAKPPDDYLCITCCVKRPRVVFYGCGHHVLCQPCYLRYAKDICPVCREPIRDASITIGP